MGNNTSREKDILLELKNEIYYEMKERKSNSKKESILEYLTKDKKIRYFTSDHFSDIYLRYYDNSYRDIGKYKYPDLLNIYRYNEAMKEMVDIKKFDLRLIDCGDIHMFTVDKNCWGQDRDNDGVIKSHAEIRKIYKAIQPYTVGSPAESGVNPHITIFDLINIHDFIKPPDLSKNTVKVKTIAGFRYCDLSHTKYILAERLTTLYKNINRFIIQPKNNYFSCFTLNIDNPVKLDHENYESFANILLGKHIKSLSDYNMMENVLKMLDLQIVVRRECILEDIHDLRDIDKLIKTDASLLDKILDQIISWKYVIIHDDVINFIKESIKQIREVITIIKKEDEKIMWNLINKLPEDEQSSLNEIDWYHW